ncbi:MAG: GNAT family N-acetyltransferase [Chloroflexi bacterium]|nr:MAG: GNAT family N-acetyltransferase [Chloroflexota bacterium]
MIATIVQLDADHAAARIDDLIHLLQDAVADGASIGFLPPLTADDAHRYWRNSIGAVEQGERLLFAALDADRLIGSVQLALEMRLNGLHRAEVQKLVVHTHFRRQGIGQRLMHAAEKAALSAGRTLLVLDTRRGDPSEQLYQQLGYSRAGVIPQYARNATGQLDDTVLYYRLLSA